MATDENKLDPETEALRGNIDQEKKDLGIVDEAEESDAEKADDKSTEDDKSKKDESAEDADKDADSEKDSDEEESDDEESDEDSEKEDDADADDEDEEADDSEHVPQNDIKAMKNSYKGIIKDLKQKLADATTGKDKKEINDDAEQDIEKLVLDKAKELNVKPDVLKSILDLANKSVAGKLKKLDEISTTYEKQNVERFNQEQETIFNTEWSKTLPVFKKDFPNATDEQVKIARNLADKLAHSKAYHRYDMDYIVFKEKAQFDKILFSPKKNTFESAGNTANADAGEDMEESTDFSNASDLSPAEFERREKAREKVLEGSPRETLTLRTHDEKGRMVTKQI